MTWFRGILLMLFALSHTAEASPLTATDLLQQYDIVTIDQATLRHQTAGTVLIGGDAEVSGTYGVNSAGQAVNLTVDGKPPLTAELVLMGGVRGQLRIEHGQALVADGAADVLTHGNASSVAVGVPDFTVQDIAQAAATESLLLSGLRDTGGTITGGQNATFTSKAGDNGLAVFNVDMGIFAQLSSLTFDAGGATTIVNVAGNEAIFGSGFNFNFDQVNSPNVLFNFFEAKTVEVRSFAASILAPIAEVSLKSGQFWGSILAFSFDQDTTVAQPRFRGDFSFAGNFDTSPVMPTPVPAGAVLMTGALALGFTWRRFA